MDKDAIKKYAIWARRELIEKVTQRALLFGVAEGQEYDANAEIVNGRVLTPTEKDQRRALIQKIREHGYEQTIEEVAYTWFNRFAALRFMEVNDYLPTHIRVFSDDDGEFKPQIMTEAIHMELDGLDRNKVFELKDANKDDELFKYLIITQCNALNSILPGIFQRIADYTELLFPDNQLREGSVIDRLVSDIPEVDFNVNSEGGQVEIIGWLYQYYISEKHEEVIDPLHGKVVKKEEVSAATQLFTTDWVVRYLIDNSVGRYWIERNLSSSLADSLTYFVKPKSGVIKTIDEVITPQEVTVFDPCVGSGHFLVYAFDVLIKVYVEYGYSERDAASEIVKHNLYGLDIDSRATQLAYFAVMMKARQYDKRFFSRGIQPNVFEIVESNEINEATVDYFCGSDCSLRNGVDAIIDTLKDAKEYGSILQMPDVDFASIDNRFNELKETISVYNEHLFGSFRMMMKVAEILSGKYAVVATNPPYLSKYDATLKKYINDHYKEYSGDLFSVFVYRNFGFCKKGGYSGFMTPMVWMFIITYEKLREFIIHEKLIVTLIQFEYSAYEESTVPICAFILQNKRTSTKGLYFRLSDFLGGMEIQKGKVLEAIDNNSVGYFHETDQSNYSVIPSTPIAYWLSDAMFSIFKSSQSLTDVAKPRQGLATSDNERFLKLWHEVEITKIGFGIKNIEDPKQYGFKWFPCTKGGNFRRWYGNNFYVINWENDGKEIKEYASSLYKNYTRTIKNIPFYFKKGLTWSTISSGLFSLRYVQEGFIFETKGAMCFVEDQYIFGVLALYNTKVMQGFLQVISPTLDYHEGSLGRTPIILKVNAQIDSLARECVAISKTDWDSFETSWDFISHPLLKKETFRKINDSIPDYYKNHSASYILEENAMTRFRMSVENCSSDVDGEYSGELVQKILDATHNEYTVFPDWKGDGVVIEIFNVSSSKPIYKGNKYKGAEEYPKRKEFRKVLYGNTNSLLNDEDTDSSKQIGIIYHAPEHAYEYFQDSFMRSWSDHVESLDNYEEDPKYKVMMIHYSEHRLWQEYNGGRSIYKLQDDRTLLYFINENKGRCTHVIFIGDGKPEIIEICDIPKLIHTCTDDIKPVCINGDSITVTHKARNQFYVNQNTIEAHYNRWSQECENRFNTLKSNEEELNRIFIDIYGLQNEFTPDVADENVTVRKADLKRDIKSFISYAVGCMLGRYSLDVPGLAYAGGEWDLSKYITFIPDDDAIIPICDDEYFNDDIVGRFVKFVEVVYGKDTLEENLQFIADGLGGKGTSREVIRRYFINDFFKDHCKTYQKRPIYWLFDSGKKNGFKCLIYMHRYKPDTLARIRTDYVHEQQARYRTIIENLQKRMDDASASEKVKLGKQLTKVQDQAKEIHEYEEKIHYLADQMIDIDLDDGVKHNYALFQDVLAKIK